MILAGPSRWCCSDKETALASLQVWVDKNTWLAYQLEVTDSSGIRTLHQFTDVRINSGLASSLFVFQVPEDIEIIDMRW